MNTNINTNTDGLSIPIPRKPYDPNFLSNIPSNYRHWHKANKRNEPIDHLTDADIYAIWEYHFADNYEDDYEGEYEYMMEMITLLYMPVDMKEI